MYSLLSRVLTSSVATAYVLLLTTFTNTFDLCLAVPAPVDLYNSGYDETNRAQQKTDSLCPENLNNDNITHFRWFRFHNGTQKCWHIDERGPCSQNMLFYRIGNTEYGECECNFFYRCARPLIYWPPENRCYFTNDQGPCKNNEWLIVTGNDDNSEGNFRPTCVPNPCVRNQTMQRSGKDRYWFEHKGECYMTLTKGYCSHPDEVLYPKWDELNPSCHIGRECNSRKVRDATIKAPAGCLPGQKLDANGQCRQLVRISWWSSWSK